MNTLALSMQLMVAPERAWRDVGAQSPGVLRVALLHTAPLALIPAVCWYFGVTRSGWSVADETTFMTHDSALVLSGMFYLAMIASVLVLGYLVHWMAATYEAESTYARGVTLITYSATPFFFGGVVGLMPNLWVDLLVGVLIGCYGVYLLYRGTAAVMRVSPERGFLYASAVVAICLVGFIALVSATIVLWDFGQAPEYRSG